MPDPATAAAPPPADTSGLPGPGAGEQSGPLSPHPEGSLAELLTLAVPLMLSTGSHSLMQWFDRLFLTRLGNDELGAAFSAGMMLWSIIAIPLGTLGYASTFVAQYHGAGDDGAARSSVWQSFWLSLVAGSLLLGFIPLAGPIFRWIGHAESMQRFEVQYFVVVMTTLPLRLVIGSFFCHFSGRGENVVPMTAAIVGNAVNIALTWALVFGRFGLPELGMVGAAWGTVIASVIELLFYFAFIALARPETVPAWWRTRRFDWTLSRRLLRFGLPNGVQMFSDAMAFTVALQLVGTIGPDELAATTIALSTNGVVFVPLIGLGMATGTIVGHRIGAGRPAAARSTVRLSVAFGLLMMGTFAALCLLAPQLILWPYARYGGAEFTRIEPLLVTLLRFLAAFALFDSLAVIMGSTIRGAGDTRYSLIVLTVTGWGVLTLPIVLMWWTGTLTLLRCWTVLTLTIAVQGACFTLRYLSGRWMGMSVIGPPTGAIDGR